MFFGLIGAVGGAFAGGFISAARCDGGLERLGVTFVGVGLGAIVAKSIALALAAHLVNHRQGNLPPTFLPTLLLAVPIPFALLPGSAAPLAIPLFFLQAWVCVKVQLGGRRVGRRTSSGSGRALAPGSGAASWLAGPTWACRTGMERRSALFRASGPSVRCIWAGASSQYLA